MRAQLTAAFVLLGALVLCGCRSRNVFPTAWLPEGEETPELHLSIALPVRFFAKDLLPGSIGSESIAMARPPGIDHYNKGSVFHVVLTNVSDHTLYMLKEDCWEGYASLDLLLWDDKSETRRVCKTATADRTNHLKPARFAALPPGGCLVWTVCFALSDDGYPDAQDETGKPYSGYYDPRQVYPVSPFPVPSPPRSSSLADVESGKPKTYHLQAVLNLHSGSMDPELYAEMERRVPGPTWWGTLLSQPIRVVLFDTARWDWREMNPPASEKESGSGRENRDGD